MALGSSEKGGWSITPKQLLWKLSDSARERRERQTLTPDAALGKRGENLAHRYLRNCGFLVLARNYRPAGGEAEVDIVARDKDITVFVEVKTRSRADFGSPDRAIDEAKQRNIAKAARAYCTRAGIGWNQVRFDTIAIVLSEPPSIVHNQDAFFNGRAI